MLIIKRKFILSSIIMLGMLKITYGLPSPGLTIKTYNDNYVPAKGEPDSGAYLGAYVLQDELIGKSMSKFNEVTGKQHASYFKYVGYGQPFPTEWVEECKSVGAIPHIAWEPNDGLAMVNDNEYLRKFAKSAKASDVPIFLRYASEMNGPWVDYSGDPTLYKNKWKIVHKVMKEEADNVIMVWTVFTFPEEQIDNYYPGDEYVDWVGVNLYNVMYHNDKLADKANKEDPLKLLDYVYNKYSHKKPIQISEYGVTNYSKTDGKKHTDYAINRINRLYGNLGERYPRVKSLFYFNVNTFVNATPDRQINNYAITEDPRILSSYKNIISSSNYLSSFIETNHKLKREVLTYNGYLFNHNGKIYVDYRFFENMLGFRVSHKDKEVNLGNNSTHYKFKAITKHIDKGFYGKTELIKGLPLREVCDKFGYKLHYDKYNNVAVITK